MDGYPLGTIPTLSLHDGLTFDQIDAGKIARDWLSRLQHRFDEISFEGLSELFIEDCWWRDIVGLTWDFSSKHGHEAISKYLATAVTTFTDLQAVTSGGLQPFLLDWEGMVWIQTGFTFKTQHGEGRGQVRLANVNATDWKAWIIFTQLEQLDYQKELEAQRIQPPSERTKVPALSNGIHKAMNPKNEELQVLVVGAGQAALALGARLKSLGISSLLVDKNGRVGDSWRSRYKSVTLHTPTYTDHYPFIRYPETWPRWLQQDQVADFMESYAQIMGLDVLLETKVTKVDYNNALLKYDIEVQRGDSMQKFSARHIVLATGVFSDEPIIPEIAGQELYKGQVFHSSQHSRATDILDIGNKKVVVIGASTSGHDVAQDFFNGGAKEVSIVQRSAIFSLSVAAFEAVILSLWNIPGISTEEADLIGNATPLAVIRNMSIGMTKKISAQDKDMLEGLKKAGMALKTGDDGYGLADHQIIKGGRFYIDHGANQLIIDGKIKIHRSENGVKEFQEDGIVLANDTKVEADVVVLATGFHPNISTVQRLMGPDVAKKLDRFGALDDEQERSGWWRRTGQPGFWYMTGSFLFCRQFSLPLALQIAAVEKGLNETYYEGYN